MASLWLALDDVTETNGAMEMFKFSDAPQTRQTNLNVTRCVMCNVSRVTRHVSRVMYCREAETGADFFIKINEDDLSQLPHEKVVKMTLARGQAEFHDAYILHRSMENKSDK